MTPWADAPWKPRAWQAAALTPCLDAVHEQRFGVVVACTGSGKSILISELVHQLDQVPLGPGVQVVVTPTRRLVQQLGDTLRRRLGPGRVGLYYTDAKQWSRRVIVCCNASAPSLARALRQARVHVELLLTDEAHRTEAATLRQAVDALDPARVLGFTATPFRSEEDESLQLFEEELYRYGISEALRDGVVVPWRVVPWTRGEAKLDDACVEMIRGMAGAGPGTCNAASKADAEAFATRLSDEGIPSKAVHSGLTEREQDRRLEALRQSELRVVVYPALLSEGVDFPWLRWGCLRRKVGARVRFVQEVGRFLRTDEGKTEAVLLDPHGLFGVFSLIGEAALGSVDGEGDPDEATEPRDANGQPIPRTVEAAELSPLAAVDAWARQLRAAAEIEGVVKPRLPFAIARAAPPTGGQLGALCKMAWAGGFLPREHRDFLQTLSASSAWPSAGACSDVLDVLGGLADTRTRWVPRLPIYLPSADVAAVESALDQGPLHASGLVWRGGAAAVVMRGPRVLHQEVRQARPEDSTLALTIRAVQLAVPHTRGDEDPVLCDHTATIQAMMGARRNTSAVDLLLLELDRGPRFRVASTPDSPAKKVCFRELARLAARPGRAQRPEARP